MSELSAPTPTPTPAQIAAVQQNLKNMQAFNDYVWNLGQSKVTNAYFLLTIQDGSDPGLQIALNILEGAFWAVAGAAGAIGGGVAAIGGFAASFLSGMASWWASSSSTPPSLNGTFSSLLTRLAASVLAVDTQLATYYNDVAGNWNQSFTYNGNTSTLSDLASNTFPVETDNAFGPLAAASLLALDQNIWQTVLKANFQITFWQLSSGPTIFSGNQNDPPLSWCQSFYASHPAYYETYQWHTESGCGAQNGWLMNEYSIGGSPGIFTDAALNDNACQYLFIDSIPGVTINANGLFTRENLFTNLGITQKTYIVATGGGYAIAAAGSAAPQAVSAPAQLSLAYLRAMKEAKTLTALIAKEGRSEVQHRVYAEAASNSVFRHDLSLRPRQTLEAFLGIRIAEAINLSVVVEDPRTFGVVIPETAEAK